MNIERANLIMIDLEGFEINVLDALRAFLTKSRPVRWIKISAETPGRRIVLLELKSYLSGDYHYLRARSIHCRRLKNF
ncbi:MAG: hypothetical protein CMM63_02265 [Rhodospirillaceae bacterium]|nr:hypothetical protein [Rhodospirillaceae bacterium]